MLWALRIEKIDFGLDKKLKFFKKVKDDFTNKDKFEKLKII